MKRPPPIRSSLFALAAALALTSCLGDDAGGGGRIPVYADPDAAAMGGDAGTGGEPSPPSGPDAAVFPPFEPPAALTVATYNVENLFDVVDDPTHDEGEFTPRAGVWDAARVAGRLTRLGRAFAAVAADIVVVNEVENEDILRELRGAIRDANGPDYPYQAVANGRDPRGIKVSVISRYPILKSFGRPINREHHCLSTANRQPVVLNGSSPEARPIFQIEVNVDADPEADLILLGNHWKAKIGDDYPCESEENRLRSALQLRELMLSLGAERPEASVLALGDFNSFEFEAPIADALEASLDLEADAEIYDAWGDAGVSAAHTSNDSRWNNVTNSSYYYSGDWTRLDHIFVTPPLLDGSRGWRLVAGSVESVHPAFLLENGRPARWDARDGSGFSDHLPVRLRLARVP